MSAFDIISLMRRKGLLRPLATRSARIIVRLLAARIRRESQYLSKSL